MQGDDPDFWRNLIPTWHYNWARQDQAYAFYGLYDWKCRYLHAPGHVVSPVPWNDPISVYGLPSGRMFDLIKERAVTLPPAGNDNSCLPRPPIGRRRRWGY